MLGFIKETILKQKQAAIAKKYPSVKLFLHPEMPSPSMNKMVEVASLVEQVNILEPQIAKLSDSELRQKTEEFRGKILEQERRYEDELKGLAETLKTIAIPEEKEKLKQKIKL